jgi:hypothetical protein
MQHLSVLLLEAPPQVVFPLARDVSTNRLYPGLGNRKRPVSALPRKILKLGTPGLDPFRRTPFDHFHRATHWRRSPEVEKKMGVILDGIN